jgi:N-acyl-D-amino-acid deacylase
VRDEHALTLADAIHRLTEFPAGVLSLKDRGVLREGNFADVVVFDPQTIADRATYANPHQLATGVDDVLVNGGFAFRDGQPTGAHTGGGCRASGAQWSWAK